MVEFKNLINDHSKQADEQVLRGFIAIKLLSEILFMNEREDLVSFHHANGTAPNNFKNITKNTWFPSPLNIGTTTHQFLVFLKRFLSSVLRKVT